MRVRAADDDGSICGMSILFAPPDVRKRLKADKDFLSVPQGTLIHGARVQLKEFETRSRALGVLVKAVSKTGVIGG